MSGGLNLSWSSPGPVSTAFMNSMEKVQALMGPFGGGKTTTVLMKHIFLAQQTQMSPIDGRRRYRLGVVRDTYRELWSTTIPSWFKRVPQSTGEWTGGMDQPAKHIIKFNDAKGVIEFEVWFRAIGEQAIETALDGVEVTSWFLNGLPNLSPDLLGFCTSRWGRYPDKMHGIIPWYGVTADLNAPEIENFVYKDFVENPQPGYKLFIQPSGLSPRAENIQNLQPGYYEDLARINSKKKWWVDRFVHNKWGYSRNGTPIYEEFDDDIHVAPEDLLPVEGRPLILGIDTALHPALVVQQRMPSTQWRWLKELYCPGMGATRFAAATLQLLEEFAPWHLRNADKGMIVGHVDPSASYGGDGEDLAWIDLYRLKTKLTLRPAPTNKFAPRRDVVTEALTHHPDGHEPGLLISPRACPIARKGFNATYRYKKKKQSSGEEMIGDDVEKNEASHVMEAGQYGMIGGGGYYDLMQRGGQQRQRLTQTTAEMD